MASTIHVVVDGGGTPWWHIAVPTLAGVAIGALASIALAWYARSSDRRDSLNELRRLAYAAFLTEAHLCAHELGKLALDAGPNPRQLPSGEVADAIWYAADARVARELRNVELVGERRSVAKAREVQVALFKFREHLSDRLRAQNPIVYSDSVHTESEYQQVRKPFKVARDEFIRHVRDELGTA
jgi:hypothetical protein